MNDIIYQSARIVSSMALYVFNTLENYKRKINNDIMKL